MALDIPSIDEFELEGRRVLVRVDINSPIDRATGRIVNENRIDRSIPTIRELADAGARVVILAHQGDALDYENFGSLQEHAIRLAAKLGRPIDFIDDVAGPAARARIADLGDGEILLLENVRIHSEEMTTFEATVPLDSQQMAATYIVRNLAPLFDLYVNDAFAAAHRRAPTLTGFQSVLPSAGGRQLIREVTMLERLAADPAQPCVFVLGGLKISDSFAMLEESLGSGVAERVLTGGVTGEIMLAADGYDLGPATTRFIADRALDVYVPEARRLRAVYGSRIEVPSDLAVERAGSRIVIAGGQLPVDELIVDIGEETIAAYEDVIAGAATVFVNGPPGMYESETGAVGTRRLWQAVAAAAGLTVIGGGDTVASASRFIDLDDVNYVSTGGGALIRYLSGQELPLLTALARRS